MADATITAPETRTRRHKDELTGRRYVINRRLALLTLAIFAVVMPSAYFWYKHQVDKNAAALLVRAEQLEAEQNWPKATAYYQRYLWARPDDTPALLKMVEAYAKGTPSPRRLSRLTQLLYQALGRAPERNDLRLLLAENLLKSGELEKAELEAEKLTSATVDEAMVAKKTIALAKYARIRATAQPEALATAVKDLVTITEELPGDVELALVTANALRQNPTAAPNKDRDPATYADEIMDRLVESSPENINALLARLQYRARYDEFALRESDLATARQLAPDHLEVLLLSAQSVLSQQGTDQKTAEDTAENADKNTNENNLAREYLQRAISVAPRDPRAYLALAKLSSSVKANAKALEWLQTGLAQTDHHLEIGLALSAELLRTGELQEAGRTLQDVQAKSTELLVRMNPAARRQLEHRISLLSARLDLANGNAAQAEAELQAIVLATEASPSAKQSAEWAQATALLAQIAAQAAQWDLAATHWEKLARAFPRNANITQSVATAYLRAGDAASAIERLDQFAQLSTPTIDLLLQLTQAHLTMQLSRPASRRNWTEFENALAAAKAKDSARWELVFAEMDYLLAEFASQQAAQENPTTDLASEKRNRAVSLLRTAEDSPEQPAAFWFAAAKAYQRLGLEVDVERAVDHYLNTEPSPVSRARLQVALLSSAGKQDEVEKVLVDLRSSLPVEQRRQIDRLRIENLISAQQSKEAHQLVKELIAADANDPQLGDPKLLAMGIELSLRLNDYQTAAEWEQALGDHKSNKFEWRYLRALRQLATYDKLDPSELDELSSSVALLRRQRTRWYPIVAISARLAQLNGDAAQALADYRLAVNLGDQRTSTLEQLVSLLYEENRLSEAEKVLDLLGEDSTGSAIRDSLAIKVALKQNRIAEALKLAEQGLESHPQEVMRHIWRANLLLRNQQPQDAVQALKQAAQRFPEDSRVWKGLFTLFVNTGRSEEARNTLSSLLVSDSLPKESRHFVVAQGFEILGDRDQAKQHYEQAVALQPDNATVCLRYAKLLSESNTVAAREQYERVLRLAPNNGEARRELASLLAATGRDEDWRRAKELLERIADESPAESATNDRLRAMLLSRKGRTREQRLANLQSARELLSTLIRTEGQQNSDLNRRLLAAAYEQGSALADDRSLLLAAREQLRYLVDRTEPSPENLVLYIEFLMRHATAETAAETAAETNATAAGESGPSSGELREVFLADAESRLRDLKRARSDGNENDPETLSSVDLTVRLLQAQGQDEEAADYVAKWVRGHDFESQDKNTLAQLYLTTGKLYSRLEQHQEAERWYRRLMKIAPRGYVMVVQSLMDQDKQQEAAELCLEVADGEPGPEEAILLARIMMSATPSAGSLPDVQAAIKKTVAKHSDNVELLQAEAVMRASQGEYDRAIASFRRMIELDSQNALAMNNLATLLGERPNQRSEALQFVDRAIGIAGRLPALLDTQGTIFLKMEDPTKAILCLEEATAAGATDPRYYFHLAAAYESAERVAEAAAALQTARDYGLEKSVLTEEDRSLLAQLDQQLKETSPQTTGAN